MRIWLFALLAGCSPPAGPEQPAEATVPSTFDVRAPAPPPRAQIARVEAREGSTIALAHRNSATVAVIADSDAGALRVFDVDRAVELAALDLGGHPSQLVMLPDRRIAVALRDRDQLAVVHANGLELEVEQRVAIAGEPIGLALAPDDRTLVVTSGWGHALTALAVAPERPLAPVRSWSLAAEPRAVVVADDGKHAFVSHAIGQHLEVVDLQGGIAKISLAGREEVAARHGVKDELPRVACQGFALAKSIAPGGRIFAPQVQVFAGDPTKPTDGYGGGERAAAEIFDVAVLDEDRPAVLDESLALRTPDMYPCTLPRAAVAARDGTLLVACDGVNEVLELDGASMSPAVAREWWWIVPAGPSGLAIDEAHRRVFVWSQLAHAVTTLELSDDHAPPHTVALEDHSKLSAPIARGRELFAATGDFRISSDGRACASCHPDGRQDSLVWSTPMGPRQTPMLAGRLAGTAPYGWNGDAKDLRAHLKRTVTRLHGSGLNGADRDALIAYITSLAAPPAPTGDATLVAEGEAIFRSPEQHCASCHGDDGRTPDGMAHDVHAYDEADEPRELDTPSLVGVGGTAPYYHDGRYATLRELLVATRGDMGGRRELTAHQLDALEAYLRTR
jgi:mono/diheme cytochrome c family protein